MPAFKPEQHDAQTLLSAVWKKHALWGNPQELSGPKFPGRSIALKKSGDYKPEQGARFEVHIEKGRGLTGPEAQSFSAHLELSDEGANWNCSDMAGVQEDERIETVRSLLNLGRSVRDIAKETGIPRSTVQRLKNKAASA